MERAASNRITWFEREATDAHPRFRNAVYLLDFDSELGVGLNQSDYDNARVSAWALAFAVEPGQWNPDSVRPLRRQSTGALVLKGLLLHEIALGGRRAAELVGSGDLIYPLDMERVSAFDEEGDWYGVEPALLAIVDAELVARVARFPQLAVALAARSGSHLRHLALQMLCSRSRRVDDRLIVLFGLLAERWGRVCSDGIRVPIQLSHRVIGQLVGAQRPSVTTAITRLRQRRLIEQLGSEGWLLRDQKDVNAWLANLGNDGRGLVVAVRDNRAGAGLPATSAARV